MGEHGHGASERGALYSHLSPPAMPARDRTPDISTLSSLPDAGSSGDEQQHTHWQEDDRASASPGNSLAHAYLTSDQSELPPDHIDRNSAAGQRFYTRRLIQEFLTSVPRSEPEARLTFLRLDGSLRVLSRAEFSEIIDNLRPRQRQLVRLAIEERWPRQRVCDYLGISLKTFERHHQEVLDLLAEM